MQYFLSWNTQRAITYRKINKIPDQWGTAVNVQAMVFGNMGSDCSTGVAFAETHLPEKMSFSENFFNRRVKMW